MLAPSTSAASSALAGGRTNARPSRAARQVIASAPRTGRSSPLSESSPANSYFEKPSAWSWCEAARMPSAMGKSNRPLSLGSSAGARLTVMRRAGNSKREFTSAARTRSRLSFTSVSGRPTMVNEGRPFPRCTSTVTSGASSPESARLWSTARDIAGYFCPSFASSSATRVSSSESFSRVRASTLAWISSSSRVARSSLAKAAESSARRFFSTSLAGLAARKSLIRALSSSSMRVWVIEIASSVESSTGVNAAAPGLADRTGIVHNYFVVPHASAGDFVVPLPRSLSPLIGNKKKTGMGCAEAGSSFHQLKGPAMKKLFLASAVSALFAAPTTVLAQARPGGVPTLDKVLEASGISVSGYIDAGYTHADRNIEGMAVPPRVFDTQNNSFALNQFGLSVAKQPKEGFGGLVNLTVGRDAQFIHSAPEATGVGASTFDLTQAYAQYARGRLTLIAGKFVTLQGTEVIWSPTNPNISHSILFGAIPFTHTGVRGAWAVNDRVSLYAGLNNGWDQLTDSNKAKTVELGASLTPIKPLTVTVSDYYGKEPVTGGDGKRNSFNAVASYAISDPLSVGVEYLTVSQEQPSGAKPKYSGVALYGSYMFTQIGRASCRERV